MWPRRELRHDLRTGDPQPGNAEPQRLSVSHDVPPRDAPTWAGRGLGAAPQRTSIMTHSASLGGDITKRIHRGGALIVHP
jgi:hypothetical protein